MGTGGVGKTTIAAALAIKAAMEGKKVLVLTIDPSKRLAQALGIAEEKGQVRVPGQDFSGSLFASVVQHQELFDELIKKASNRYPGVLKLLDNKLYRQLTTSLSGSQEFTSLEALYQAHQSKEYDLIILDTPPSKHVMDFLKAPQKLIEVLNKTVVEWLSNPHKPKSGFFKKIIHQGTQTVLKILENLTGQEFLSQLAQFFEHLGEWQSQLQDRIVEMQRLLASDEVQFCMVTGLSAPHLSESRLLQREMKKNGATLSVLFVNKAFPNWYLNEKNKVTQSPSLGQAEGVLYSNLKNYFKGQEALLKTFESEQNVQLSIVRIPEFEFEIKDFESLKLFTKTNIVGFTENDKK